jgi:hypothetical protein
MEDKNLYDILGLPVGSKSVAIKRAYRKLVFQYHPDSRQKNLSNEASKDYDARLAEIQEAYDSLSDEQFRVQYDATLALLEDQKDAVWDDGGVWNIPSGNPIPFVPMSSGSYFSVSGMPFTSGSVGSPFAQTTVRFSGLQSTSTIISSFPKTRINIRVNDVVAAGVNGLMQGQVVYVTISGGVVGVSPSTPAPNIVSMPCVILRAHYGIAPGLPAYGDFELEEL